MRWALLIIIVYCTNGLYAQPIYSVSIGLNYSDFYGYAAEDMTIYRELQNEFAEIVSIRTGLEVEGNISKALSYRSGIIYRSRGTTGAKMNVISAPLVLFIGSTSAKIGMGFSPSIMLNSGSYDHSHYHYPIHMAATFKLLDRLLVSVGHLRQFNSVITVNPENFNSPRMIPEIKMKVHETYLSIAYQMF